MIGERSASPRYRVLRSTVTGGLPSRCWQPAAGPSTGGRRRLVLEVRDAALHLGQLAVVAPALVGIRLRELRQHGGALGVGALQDGEARLRRDELR